jgi:hypothetical protein
VPVAQAGLVHRGDAVTVTLPSGTPRSGRVSSVSPVVTDGGASSQGGPSTAPNSQGGPQQPQVSAQVVLTGLAGRAGDTARRATVDTAIDQAPVSVTVVDRRVRGVLAVPITALVALAGGGYGVWVDTPGPRHLVPVTPGLFASSLVEVSGSGLAVGDAVEVPSS